MHGVRGVGPQFTQVHHKKQLPGDASTECEDNDETGAYHYDQLQVVIDLFPSV